MRWFLLLLLALFLFWKFLPEPEPVPVEDTVIGPQLQALDRAKGLEAETLEAAEERKRRIEDASDD